MSLDLAVKPPPPPLEQSPFLLCVCVAGFVGLLWVQSKDNIRNSESPDDKAQSDLCLGLRDYAGAYTGLYPVGRLNEVVYGVTGGMEDWAYAAGMPALVAVVAVVTVMTACCVVQTVTCQLSPACN